MVHGIRSLIMRYGTNLCRISLHLPKRRLAADSLDITARRSIGHVIES